MRCQLIEKYLFEVLKNIKKIKGLKSFIHRNFPGASGEIYEKMFYSIRHLKSARYLHTLKLSFLSFYDLDQKFLVKVAQCLKDLRTFSLDIHYIVEIEELNTVVAMLLSLKSLEALHLGIPFEDYAKRSNLILDDSPFDRLIASLGTLKYLEILSLYFTGCLLIRSRIEKITASLNSIKDRLKHLKIGKIGRASCRERV